MSIIKKRLTPFGTTLRGSRTAFVALGSHVSLRGMFTVSGALDVLHMKKEDVLKFFAARTYLGGTNLDFQMKSSTFTKRKVMASALI